LKLGIVGLPGSGKSTVFRALTGGLESGDGKGRQEPGLGVVMVEDERLDFLTEHYKPGKVTPVHVQYLDIAGLTGEGKPGRDIGERVIQHIRPLDALVHCVRFFDSPVLGPAQPLKEFAAVEEEMILSDLAIVERRIDRLKKDVKKGRKELAEELRVLEEAEAVLGDGKPLRLLPSALESEILRGFSFLSSKPQLVLVNTDDKSSAEEVRSMLEQVKAGMEGQPHVAVDWLYADTEAEIARLDPEDALEFLAELELEEGAKERIVRTSFELLRLIVFFTTSDQEVRAWPLSEGLTAANAAGTVHTDMERGFIRAEVTAFDDFKSLGSEKAAKEAGKLRLEGRDYKVKDADIILFRFNV